jgi:hypothetical protein
MTKKSNHVIPATKGGWSVKKSGSTRASKHFETKEDAVKYARKISRDSSSELYIHKKDGTIQERDSFGNDPFPKKDKK